MTIGVISDIHGNHYALQSVLQEAKNLKVSHLFVLGDLVGYYYGVEEVLSLLSEWSCDMIQGNHERILFEINQDEKFRSEVRNKYGIGHEMALAKLTIDHFHFLESLPEKKEVYIGETSFLLSHGSPWNKDLYLYPDTPKEIFEKFDQFKFNFQLIGHSHYSFGIYRSDSIIINPGSVGQSREKGGVASWVLINTVNQSFQFRYTKYDTSNLKLEVKKYDRNNTYNYKILNR